MKPKKKQKQSKASAKMKKLAGKRKLIRVEYFYDDGSKDTARVIHERK